jgi:hypothetical protein
MSAGPTMHSEDGHLYYGGDINNHGEIVGIALDLNAGTSVAFLAVPTGDGEDCEANPLAVQRSSFRRTSASNCNSNSASGRSRRGSRDPKTTGATPALASSVEEL